MGIVFLEKERYEFSGVEAEVKCPEALSQVQMAVFELPIGQEPQLSGGVGGEDALAGTSRRSMPPSNRLAPALVFR